MAEKEFWLTALTSARSEKQAFTALDEARLGAVINFN
jgi:hypothetical protein